MVTLTEAAKKYESDWNHHRFAYTKDYTPESAFIAGANWMRDQFTLEGSTDCVNFEECAGLSTIYSTLGGRCIECAHKERCPDTNSGPKDGG